MCGYYMPTFSGTKTKSHLCHPFYEALVKWVLCRPCTSSFIIVHVHDHTYCRFESAKEKEPRTVIFLWLRLVGHRSERRRPFPEQPLDTFSVGAMATLPAFRFSFLRPRNCRYFLSSSFEAPKPSPKSAAKALLVKYPRNPYLKQVISQGMPYLEASTLEMLQNCGRESLCDKVTNGPS